MSELSVNLSKTINAPIESVFDAWLNPETMSRFILPMPGMPAPEIENNPVEGGRFTIVMNVGDDKIPHCGTYLSVDRPAFLKFSWESPYSPDGSTVALTFNAIDENTTRLDLEHVKFLHEEARSDHEGGWGSILDKLAEIC